MRASSQEWDEEFDKGKEDVDQSAAGQHKPMKDKIVKGLRDMLDYWLL